jgi:hypothetical protein
MALDVTALNDFNNEVAGELVVKSVYGGSTMEYITIQEGVKHQEPINLMEVDLYIQNAACSTDFSGSLAFTQRNITVCPRTSQDGICLKTMDKKYLGISALEPGSYNETFALAGAYSDLLVNKFQKANDQFLWQQESGSASSFGGTCEASGLLRILSSGSAADAALTAYPANIVGTTTASLDNLETMLEALPADVADREDLTFFLSVGKFREFISSIRSANNFYFDPVSITNRGGLLEIGMPFQPNVKVVGTTGINTSRIVLGPAKQIVAGTDLMSDFSEFQLWYDINSDQLRHRIATKLGVQVAYPEFWVSNNA